MYAVPTGRGGLSEGRSCFLPSPEAVSFKGLEDLVVCEEAGRDRKRDENNSQDIHRQAEGSSWMQNRNGERRINCGLVRSATERKIAFLQIGARYPCTTQEQSGGLHHGLKLLFGEDGYAELGRLVAL